MLRRGKEALRMLGSLEKLSMLRRDKEALRMLRGLRLQSVCGSPPRKKAEVINCNRGNNCNPA